MNRKSPVLVTTLVLALLAAACGDDDGASPDPTTTTTSAPAETTTSVDPFTVPDEITVEYVEAVLTELEKINGDALRLAVAEGMSPEVSELLLSIHTEALAGPTITVLNQAQAGGFEGIRRPPGDVVVTAVNQVDTTLECIVIDAEWDYSAVSIEPSVETARVRLVQQPGNDTSWVYAEFQALPTHSEPISCGV